MSIYYLGQVDAEFSFDFFGQGSVVSIPALHAVLEHATEDQFSHHVDGTRNDIALWVREVVKDEALSHLLEIHPTQQEMTAILKMRIAQLEKKAGWK